MREQVSLLSHQLIELCRYFVVGHSPGIAESRSWGKTNTQKKKNDGPGRLEGNEQPSRSQAFDSS
jgi:hypothetical protein